MRIRETSNTCRVHWGHASWHCSHYSNCPYAPMLLPIYTWLVLTFNHNNFQLWLFWVTSNLYVFGCDCGSNSPINSISAILHIYLLTWGLPICPHASHPLCICPLTLVLYVLIYTHVVLNLVLLLSWYATASLCFQRFTCAYACGT